MVSMSKSKMENATLPKRFYKQAAFEPQNAAYCITLDGKQVRTPGRNLLQVNDAAIAAAIAAEWDAQQDVINPHFMPLTRLAHIAIDRSPLDRAELLKDIASYTETDLLCYRAPIGDVAHPMQADNLVFRQKQDATFDPVLAWVHQECGAEFTVTDGLLPVPQPADSLAVIAAAFAKAKDGELAALAMMIPPLGSALLALALWKGFMDIEAVLLAARLDENCQAERWGMDPEVQRAWEHKAKDIRASAFFLTGKRL